MSRFVIFLACLSALFSLSVAAQSSRQTRPRIVQNPASVDPPTEDSVGKGSPPVLKGGTKTAPAATAPANGEVVEEDDDVIRVETNLVTFPVSVVDRDGRFITGLKKEDFQIYENGQEQRIDSFNSVEVPFTVILMIDVSPSTQFRIEEIQDAAIAFVDQLRNSDRVMVVSFDERVNVLSPPTSNRSQLRNAIRQARFGDGTSLYEAVDYVVNRELPRLEGRKAVVLFTDGVDTTSRRANYQNTARATEESEALFFPIRYDTSTDNGGGYGGGYPQPFPRRRRRGGGGGWGDVLGDILGGGGGIYGGGYPGGGGGAAGSSRAEYETGRQYLEALARNSGGRKYEANNNLNAAFSGIAEELRRQYSLGYYPETVGAKGDRKTIRVRVKRPNLIVRAKTSYIVGENQQASK